MTAQRPQRASGGFASRAVHAGERAPRPDFIPTTTPIYATSSFSYDDTHALDAVFANEREGYVYSRYGNPTTRALEVALAELEGTEDALAFGSGMAAIHAAILSQVQTGSRVVAARDVYGATYAVLTNIFATLGVKPVFVDILDFEAVEAALVTHKPKLLAFETISNPLLRVANIAALSQLAHAHGARVMVDNSFASPYLVNPARYGADLVVHSTTKYLGGHGDTTGGIIAATGELIHVLREQNKLVGSLLSPFEAWLTLRGIKTLSLRLRQQSENAAVIATWLFDRSDIEQVYYPGNGDLGDTAAQFNNAHRGGMVAFEIAGSGREEVFQFLQSLRLCVPATTLGDVYSLVLYPAISSHRALTTEQRAEIGIGDNLVRLSVGIEDVADIIADLAIALDAIRTPVGAHIGGRFEEI